MIVVLRNDFILRLSLVLLLLLIQKIKTESVLSIIRGLIGRTLIDEGKRKNMDLFASKYLLSLLWQAES